MPDPTPTAAGPDELGLVLFGLPSSGKSSLLAALAESARTQEHLLGGKVIDRSGRFDELRQRLDGEGARRTGEEMLPYPIRYEPQGGGVPVNAVIIDCDGRAATELLLGRRAMDEASPEGSLARAMLDAEALVLVVDAAAPPAQLDADFAEFERFLRAMEQGRGERVEVGGLPVFLVLNKCDLLAQPGDNSAAWIDRIEDRKRAVGARFRALLARDEAGDDEAAPRPGFGWIDLHVWATAVKRPALAGAAARPREPYGVAELFRQCLSQATTFRHHEARAARRLVGTLIASGLLVFAMTATAAGMFLTNRGSKASVLRSRVESVQFGDRGEPAERLRGDPGQLRQKLARLKELRGDPQFAALPEEHSRYVKDRIDELEEYTAYLEKLLKEPRPDAMRSEKKLADSVERLEREFKVPHKEWTATPAALMRERRLKTAGAMLEAVRSAKDWFEDSRRQAQSLQNAADYPAGQVNWPDWRQRALEMLEPTRPPPFPPMEHIPGAAVTWSEVMRFDSVVLARTEAEKERDGLGRVLDVCSAVGLVQPSPGRPAALVFGRNLTLAQARTRAQELRAAYPAYLTYFQHGKLPPALQEPVAQAARVQYALLLAPARAEVLRQLRLAGSGSAETVAKWSAVRHWLNLTPEQLGGWRVLADALLRLAHPSPTDPVKAMIDFLHPEKFTLDAQRLDVVIPDRLRLVPRDGARLIVMHPASGAGPALAFSPAGKSEDRTHRTTTYHFRLAQGRQVVYQVQSPGQQLWVELELTGDRRLVWSRARSALYQFEAVHNPPRLQEKGARSLQEGRLLDDVRLSWSTDNAHLPTVPDLMPWVAVAE